VSEQDELLDAVHAGIELAEGEVLIDLSEADTFDPFTAVVPVVIVTAEMKTGKDSGKPYIKLRLKVTSGEYEGRVLFTNLNLTGKGAGFAMKDLEKFGATSKDGKPINKDNPRIDIEGLPGLEARASVAPDSREEYSDQVQVNKILKGEADPDTAEVK
jgi:hypothetical protein